MPAWLKKFIELNPVLIRGLLVTIAALLARFGVNTVLDNETVELIIDLFVAVSALITALWARDKVIAENKVIAWKLDPADSNTIVAGPATVRNDFEMEQVYQAAQISKFQGEARSDFRAAA